MQERREANRAVFYNRLESLWDAEKALQLKKKEEDERAWFGTIKGQLALTKLTDVRLCLPTVSSTFTVPCVLPCLWLDDGLCGHTARHGVRGVP